MLSDEQRHLLVGVSMMVSGGLFTADLLPAFSGAYSDASQLPSQIAHLHL